MSKYTIHVMSYTMEGENEVLQLSVRVDAPAHVQYGRIRVEYRGEVGSELAHTITATACS